MLAEKGGGSTSQFVGGSSDGGEGVTRGVLVPEIYPLPIRVFGTGLKHLGDPFAVYSRLSQRHQPRCLGSIEGFACRPLLLAPRHEEPSGRLVCRESTSFWGARERESDMERDWVRGCRIYPIPSQIELNRRAKRGKET